MAAEAALYTGVMTFEMTALRWYHEVGQHHRNFETTIKVLDGLKRNVGTGTDLRDISDALVASLVARRRGERVRRLHQDGRIHEGKLVSPATVNRTCTQPLREILLRAKNVWKVAIGDVRFGEHLLKAPQERVREASIGEENAIMGELDRGYGDAVRFAFLNGCRRMEILGLKRPHVDFFSRRFTVTGKGGKSRTIPMSQETFDILWSQKDIRSRRRKRKNVAGDQKREIGPGGRETGPVHREIPGSPGHRFARRKPTVSSGVLESGDRGGPREVGGRGEHALATTSPRSLRHGLRRDEAGVSNVPSDRMTQRPGEVDCQ